MTAGTRRIFVAVALDPALRDAVLALERRLEDAGARLRWVKPENLHFTLRFLGEISEPQLNRVRSAVRDASAGIAPFRIVLASIGAFPSARRPQVLWAGIREGVEAMEELARRLDDALALERFPREPRGFTPHLTLARVKDARLWGDLSRVLPVFEGEDVGEQDVTSLLVMESVLRPQGPIYTPVEEVRLTTHEK